MADLSLRKKAGTALSILFILFLIVALLFMTNAKSQPLIVGHESESTKNFGYVLFHIESSGNVSIFLDGTGISEENFPNVCNGSEDGHPMLKQFFFAFWYDSLNLTQDRHVFRFCFYESVFPFRETIATLEMVFQEAEA